MAEATSSRRSMASRRCAGLITMLLASAVAACAGSAGGTAQPQLDTATVTVAEVVDGDTVRMHIDGLEQSVRLIGINAPERGECYANEATQRLAQLLDSGPLRLERDVSDRDQYGRLLRYVFAGDVFVNGTLVGEGHALAIRYEPDVARDEDLQKAEEQARENERGQWHPDACGASTGAAIEIGAVNPDPPGDDTVDLNGEWVQLRNVGSAPVSLGGWVVKDESASHRYRFVEGFELAAGAGVRLHTGCGTDTSAAVHWCVAGSAVWNNDGDTVFVLDPSGNVVARRRYP